jgi:hypothetical protein
VQDTQPVADALPIAGDHGLRALELFARRQQLGAIQIGPAVELGIGQLQVLGADLQRQVDDAVRRDRY